MTSAATADQPAAVAQITIDRDNITVDKSVRIKRGNYVVPDKDNNGVLQITADDVVVDFQGALLTSRKDPANADKEQFKGIGVAVNGHKNVTRPVQYRSRKPAVR